MARTPRARITHVIYDLDGTLLDTEPMYIATTNAVLARHGMTLAPEIRVQMIGRPTSTAVPLMIEQTGIAMTAEEFIEERDRLLHELFPTAKPRRGARELTLHLAAQGVPQAVATSSSLRTLALKVRSDPGWFASFQAMVTADEVAHGKPAPDIFIEAAHRLGAPDPASCLVFEDAPSGIEAALAAGMHVIAVPEDVYRDRISGAHEILDGFEAFDPAEWGLPTRWA